MVKVRIFVEGGAHPNNTPNAATATNSVFLRQSLNKLLNDAFDNSKVSIECDICASYTGAKKSFVNNADTSALLLIDLDGIEATKTTRLSELGLNDCKDRVFFMVQQMEAWILSQPMRLQEGLSKRYEKHTDFDMATDPLIAGIDVQTISNPSQILDHLLKKHFHELKNGVRKELKYGKLKKSYDLIKLLDITELRNNFIDVENLLRKI